MKGKRATPEKQKQESLAQFARVINQANSVYVRGKRYIQLNEIGSGSGSKIFKAIDDSGNIYAIKRVQYSPDETELLANYRNEIQLLEAMADNDRIINIIDHEITSSEVIIVLELGDADLREIISKPQQLSPNYIRYTWQQMLEAVEAIHERKIIHGDLKPSNFLMVKGTLKLIDFGIARVIRGDATSTVFNDYQLSISSYKYKAPENLAHHHDRDDRGVKLGRSADVWSLGCILYELVYGESPFPAGIAQFRKAVLDSGYEIPFPELPSFHDFDSLVDVMQRCLQRRPNMRPSIEELLCHEYIQQPSSYFVEKGISIEENLRQFAQQIQTDFSDSDFESAPGRRVISMLARNLISGKPMIVANC